MPTTDLLSDLNPVQKQAVQHTEGPTLILAGAGSGKTKALTHRVAYLIREKQVPPESILVVTFTNKASGEMKTRILNLLNNGQHTSHSHPVMGTFHSFCSRILRKEGMHIGLPDCWRSIACRPLPRRWLPLRVYPWWPNLAALWWVW